MLPSIPVQGMERATLQIAKMMREQGADVLFVTERTYGDRVRREVEAIGCRWTKAPFTHRLRVTWRPAELIAVGMAWLAGAVGVCRAYGAYRPTHVLIPDLPAFLYAVPLLSCRPVRAVFRLPNPPEARVSSAVTRLIWRGLVVRLCHVLVCNSEYARARLASMGVGPGRVRVIYNCVAERRPKAESDAPRLNPARLNVLYLGRMTREKGVGELYEVAKRLVRERPDVDFHFVGEHRWQNPFAEEIIGDIAAAGLGSRIGVYDEVNDVFGLLRQCAVHVCPSKSSAESLPNVLLEAKAEGVPSVVFPVAGLPEAVTHGVDGFVCREASAGALYEAICHVLDNPAARQAAGEAARRSLDRFSRARAEREWTVVFREASSR